MAVFLAFLLVAAGLSNFSFLRHQSGEKGVLGGPSANIALAEGDPLSRASAFGVEPVVLGYASDNTISRVNLPLAIGTAAELGDPGQPIGPVFSRESLIAYKIQRGDTLSGVAAYFGISLNTIIAANPSIRGKLLKVGDKLNILPTSGIVYQTRGGDTLESIADYFNIPTEKISAFNKSVNFATLGAGVSLVIPGAKTAFASSRPNSLPDFNSSFMMPADGYNWGILHHYNAVDIAGSCGTPIVASAEGLVVPDENYGDGISGCPGADVPSGCNGGYGRFVLLEHPFGDGVRTRYAHMDAVSAQIGDYVKQGQQIGTMGQTGDATGCHIHFEVIGAQNPFAKS